MSLDHDDEGILKPARPLVDDVPSFADRAMAAAERDVEVVLPLGRQPTAAGALDDMAALFRRRLAALPADERDVAFMLALMAVHDCALRVTC